MTTDANNSIRIVVCRPTSSDVTSILTHSGFTVLEAKALTECSDIIQKEHCHSAVIDYDVIREKLDGSTGNVFELILRSLCSAPCFVLCKLPIPAHVAENMWDHDFFPNVFFPVCDTKRSIEMLPNKIRKVIDKNRAAGLEIRWPAESEKNGPLSLDKKDVHWVMSHLLPSTTRKLHVDIPYQGKNSMVLTGRISGLPEAVFIKVGRADRIKKEIDNYHEFIHWRLANTTYAFIERSGWWDYLGVGGIIYNFHSSKSSAETFSNFYRREDTDTISNVIAVLFDSLDKGLYREHLLLSDNLYETYAGYLNLKEKFNNRFPDIDFGLSNAAQWVMDNSENSNLQKDGLLIYQARTHGDLWGENILIEKLGNSQTDNSSQRLYSRPDEFQTWLIDFERAGWGHAFRDFVELEVDILTRLAGFLPKDSLDFYELAVSLTKSRKILEKINNSVGKPISGIRYWTEHVEKNPQAQKAFRVIQQLRTSLTTIWSLRSTDAREYYWGLLLDSLFVALNPEMDTQQRKNAATYASVLAGRLQNWEDEKWPPDGWRNVDFKESPLDIDRPVKSPNQKERIV